MRDIIRVEFVKIVNPWKLSFYQSTTSGFSFHLICLPCFETNLIMWCRDFCGFCSVGCRDIQISLDKLIEKQVELEEKQAAGCKDNADPCKGMADMKSQFSYK